MMKILLDKKETAAAVSLSESTIERLVKAEKFPMPVKQGSRVLWRTKDLEQWADNLPTNTVKKETRGRKRLAVL